jgi:putative DNA primase/helicase
MKSPRSAAWAKGALKSACQRIAAARQGTRNGTLNSEAFCIFRIVAGGNLDENEVRAELFQAARGCGLVDDDGAASVENTINSAANAGLAQPLYYERKTNGSQLQSNDPQPQPPARPPPPPLPPPPSPSSQPQPQLQPQQRAAGAKPIVRLIDGELPEAVDKAEEALIAVGGRHLYQRGTQIVHPIRPKVRAANSRWTRTWKLEAISKPTMIEIFTRVVQFERWDGRSNDFVVKDCPEQVAEIYLARVGHWKLLPLFGIVNAPFLRTDGTPCERPGYDHDSGLLYIPEKGAFAPIPTNPSEHDARAALARLKEKLLAEFPFVEEVDRSVALSAFLTAFDRHAMATAPLHAFTSPTAGTGKSLLVDLVSILLSGRPAPVIAQGRTAEETEKRLASALLSGDRVIVLDNCDHEVDSALLCQALTQEQLNIRLLGYSRNIEVPMLATFFATGNNLVIASDLTRRTLLCRLDAKAERPELRTFKSNVLEVARSERGALVGDVLTILRAWHLAHVGIGIDPFGSFEDWSFRVRQSLLWLDQTDPCDSVQTVRENDPLRCLLDAVLHQWKEKLGVTNAFTVQQVIARAVVDPDFHGALMAVAASRQGITVSNSGLGQWLSKNNGKIVGRLKLLRKGIRAGYQLWQVIEI